MAAVETKPVPVQDKPEDAVNDENADENVPDEKKKKNKPKRPKKTGECLVGEGGKGVVGGTVGCGLRGGKSGVNNKNRGMRFLRLPGVDQQTAKMDRCGVVFDSGGRSLTLPAVGDGVHLRDALVVDTLEH